MRIQLVSAAGKAPCKDCEDRHPACHDKCERFADFRKEIDRIKEAKRQHMIREGWSPHVIEKKDK